MWPRGGRRVLGPWSWRRVVDIVSWRRMVVIIVMVVIVIWVMVVTMVSRIRRRMWVVLSGVFGYLVIRIVSVDRSRSRSVSRSRSRSSWVNSSILAWRSEKCQ